MICDADVFKSALLTHAGLGTGCLAACVSGSNRENVRAHAAYLVGYTVVSTGSIRTSFLLVVLAVYRADSIVSAVVVHSVGVVTLSELTVFLMALLAYCLGGAGSHTAEASVRGTVGLTVTVEIVGNVAVSADVTGESEVTVLCTGRAGRNDASYINVGVTLEGCYLCVAESATLALKGSDTVGYAGRGVINLNVAVTDSGDNLLNRVYLAATYTAATFAETGFSTGRLNRYVYIIVVTERCKVGVRSDVIAGCALLMSSVSCFGTGRIESFYVLESVTESIRVICNVGMITNGAGVGGVSAVYTVGSSNYGIVAMSCRGDLCMRLYVIATYARCVSFVADFGTSRLERGNVLKIVTESIRVICNVGVITNGAGVCRVSAIYTVGRSNYANIVVSKCTNHLLSNENLVTNGTLLTCCKTRVGTVGCHCGNVFYSVTECIYYLLSNENLVTNGTLLTCGKTRVITVGCYCGNYFLGVTECFYYLLSNGDLAANGTLLTLGETCVNTGGINCGDCLLGMTECGNDLLRYCELTANRALLTCRKTRVGTVGCYCGYVYLGMTECGNYILSVENLAAYGAVRALGKTCFGTCGSLCHIDDLGVTESINVLLLNESLVAYGAVLTFGKTLFGTCGSLCCIDDLGVTETVYEYCIT